MMQDGETVMNDDIRNQLPVDDQKDTERLEEIRERIAGCDLRIADALSERMYCVQEIIEYKKDHGMVIFQGDQEKKQRGALAERIKGHPFEKAISDIYREIVRNSRIVQAEALFSYNIMLIGFMGAGKTTVADYLSSMLEMEEVDTDEMIVNWRGMSVNEIFARFGEEYFRDLETSTLKALSGCRQLIVSCGGGVPLRRENLEIMRSRGVIVWLTASPETIYDRVHLSTTRPLLKGNNSIEGIERLLNERLSRYENAADITVPTDGLTVHEVCELLVKRVLEYQKARENMI